MREFKYLLVLISFISCNDSVPQSRMELAYPNLSFTAPVDYQHPNDNTNRVFVVEQEGKIILFNNSGDVSESKVFLDITDRVVSGGERGLLGLAFHPDFRNNGYFYVNYTGDENNLKTYISRFSVSGNNPDSADKESELNLITQDQPYANHNGGQVAFGPDGYLYIALGDGGSGGDPHNNGQSLTTLLGKILRIDVNNTQGSLNYAIPPENPFAGNTAGQREEIFAYGLRNPWRFSYDFHTGWLWCADVGQNAWEEIDLIKNGHNYGWRYKEGNHCYDPSSGCDTIPGLTDPIFEYGHNASGGQSITGGYVYRGANIPELYGKYIYGDYVSSRIWALSYDSLSSPENELLLTSEASPLSFGQDKNKEIYLLAYGNIYKFIPTNAVLAPSNLTASLIPANHIQLKWIDNSGNEDGFLIQRKTPQGDFETIDSTEANTVSYIDNQTNPNNLNYSYRTAAYNTSSNSGWSNEASVNMPVDVKDEGNNITPSEYKINQNYPNPFNPNTTIRYSIPEQGKVVMKVYDSLGKEIETLVDETKTAGNYEINFDGSNLSTGVYLCRISADKFVSTIKLILMK